MTREEFIANAWRRSAGIPEIRQECIPPLVELMKTEWSDVFEKLMRNRLIMGRFRYGALGSKDKRQYDRVSAALKRLTQYSISGNTELLVDVANLCLLEYVEGRHPQKHFSAVDDGEHVK